jgi:hypothetical protein
MVLVSEDDDLTELLNIKIKDTTNFQR